MSAISQRVQQTFYLEFPVEVDMGDLDVSGVELGRLIRGPLPDDVPITDRVRPLLLDAWARASWPCIVFADGLTVWNGEALTPEKAIRLHRAIAFLAQPVPAGLF